MSDIGDLFEESSSPPASNSEVSPSPDVAPQTPVKQGLPEAFKKVKFPPVSKRLYFPLISGGGGLNCLPLASTGITTASFFKTLPRDTLRVPMVQIVRTDHRNLVNVQELYLAPNTVIITYDSWGVPLLEICRSFNIFAKDESAVATICTEVLKGLKYIHDEIGIAHSNISCGTVLLTENGIVKIADTGESMMQPNEIDDKYLDCRAVCQIAKVLLELESGKKPMTTLRLEAEDFANTPLGATVDELLQRTVSDPRQMRLFDLPPEVLLCIADQCGHTRDLDALARATRRTYDIFQEALYKFAARQQGCSALHFAARGNNYRTAEALLSYGADINALCKSYTALMTAVVFESESVMDLLLAREDLDVNGRNPNGETALWWAAYTGHRQAVNKLLQCKDILIDCPDTLQEMTPFSAAVANGHAEVSQDLLATGKIKVNAQDKCRRTPVHHAMASGNPQVVALLLFSREVDIHFQDDYQRTPFWYAVRYDNLLAAKLLLMRGADPNLPDIYRITPLNTAILQGSAPMLSLLLGTQGVDVSSRMDPGVLGVASDAQPPICLAVELGNRETVKMLLCRGADANAYNTLGYPALHLAVQMTDVAMARLLLSHRDLDVNKRARDKCQFTALHQAASAGKLRMVNLLLMKSGIDINARDIKERTPLWWATKNNHSAVAKRLLAENGLDINAASVGGSTPLHHAVNRANSTIVHSLLAEDRLDPNIPDKAGLTPLGCAARNGDRKMVDLLLTREDIRINSGGFRSNSPLTLAAVGGHFSVMLRLLRHAQAGKMMVA
ncbi:hypothetical protein CNMCM7691_005626 [Aspergillus felis]|uniref:Protein kinase domain-containing protein n=1 Tax=Aspergillus felis TaxID=1287682 RepID=A0A8H6QNZ0_9EURO|nr:hypothetical protein CNMCM7691_005626 [Aspergillus felis]